MLKAVLLEQIELYKLKQGLAYTLGFVLNKEEIATVLIKLY